MEGDIASEDEMGVIPRAARAIFEVRMVAGSHGIVRPRANGPFASLRASNATRSIARALVRARVYVVRRSPTH